MSNSSRPLGEVISDPSWNSLRFAIAKGLSLSSMLLFIFAKYSVEYKIELLNSLLHLGCCFCLSFWLLDQLCLDIDVDFITDEDATRFQGLIPIETPILSIDGG